MIATIQNEDSATRRVREASLDSNALDVDDGTIGVVQPKKRKIATAPKKIPTKKKKEKDSEFVTTLPWPEHFLQLERTFKVGRLISMFHTY